MTYARRNSVVIIALFAAIAGLALMFTSPASAGQRPSGQETATQLTLPRSVHTLRIARQTRTTRYIVRRGDTLSSISKRLYGHANRWTALWWTNHKRVHNPNSIYVGQWLILSKWHPKRAWLMTKALRHIPRPVVRHLVYHHSSPAYTAPPTTTNYSGSTGYEQCVIRNESGGNPQALNTSSGASGLYQFLDSTWQSVTGLSGSARNYSVATQRAAFLKLYAEAGRSPWITDGC